MNKFGISNLSTYGGGADLSSLTPSEVLQLQNIDLNTISNTQWSYLGNSNQGIATSDSPVFADLTLSNDRITLNSTNQQNIPDANSTLADIASAQTFTNKTLTAPVISTIVNTGTLTLPTSTDTLVGRDTTDTLTNKTLTTPVIASMYQDAGLTKLMTLPNVASDTLAYLTQLSDMKRSGFTSWDGGSPYWSITAGPQFNLLQSGVGYVHSVRVTFTTQNVALTSNDVNVIYIDNTGTIQVTNSPTDSTFSDNIVLFEVLHDGTNSFVKKENHGFDFDSTVSRYEHNITRSVSSNVGCDIAESTNNMELKISEGTLYDHGLNTSVSTTDPISINTFYTNGSGNWILYTTANALPVYYNNSGTPTALSAGKFGVYTIYGCLDDLNTSTAKYISVMDSSEYNNEAQAIQAITDNTIATQTNELQNLELVQLGYTVFSQSTGDFSTIIVSKQTNGTYTSGNSISGSHLTLTDLNSGQYGDGGHDDLVISNISASTAPTVNDDTDTYKNGSIWVKQDTSTKYILVDNTDTKAQWDELVDLTGTQSLSNKTLTSPEMVDFKLNTNDRFYTTGGNIITVPNYQDVIVLQNYQQSLAGKGIRDDNCYWYGNADPSKRLRWEINGTITAGQTRVLTPLDEDGTIVLEAGSQTLTNKTLTTPVIPTIYQDAGKTQLMTLPNTASDTFVCANASQELRNKCLVDSVCWFCDDADTSKKVGIQCSGLTTSTTRVLTVQDQNYTLIGTDTTDTLTNKTLTAPIISTISNTGTLTLPTSTDTLVGRATTDTLTNKTLTDPVIATIVNAGNDYDLPNVGGNDTLVSRTSTDNLANKSMKWIVNSVSSNTTLDSSYAYVVCSGHSGITITLPDASLNVGRMYHIVNMDAGNDNVIVATNSGSEYIDDDSTTSVTLTTKHDRICLVCTDSTHWHSYYSVIT